MDRSADYLELARQLRQSPGNVDRAQMYASLASAEKLDSFLDLTDEKLSEIRPAIDVVAADTEEQLRLLRADVRGLGNWLGDVIQEIRELLATLLEQANEVPAPAHTSLPIEPPPAVAPPPPPPAPVTESNRLPQDFVNRFGYLERSVAAVSERATAVDATSTELTSRVDAVSADLAARVNTVSAELGTRVDAVSADLESRLATLDEVVGRIDQRTVAIDSSVRELSHRTARVESQLDDLAEGLIEVEDRMARRLAEAVEEITRSVRG